MKKWMIGHASTSRYGSAPRMCAWCSSQRKNTAMAANRQSALFRIKEVMPDLIIMDVMLEKMSDGFDLSRELKSDEKYKKIPLLMMTSIGNKTGFRFSEGAGDKVWLPVDDYAEKPLKPEELISRIETLLSK